DARRPDHGGHPGCEREIARRAGEVAGGADGQPRARPWRPRPRVSPRMTSPNSPTPEPITRLIDAFNALPGIGPKSAQRLTYHLLRVPPEEAQRLAEAIHDARVRIQYCRECYNYAEEELCRFCRDESRDATVICVVEQPLDIL